MNVWRATCSLYNTVEIVILHDNDSKTKLSILVRFSFFYFLKRFISIVMKVSLARHYMGVG